MRLYKDVKVKIHTTINIEFSEQDIYKAQIKKYNGKTTIMQEITKPLYYDYATYKKKLSDTFMSETNRHASFSTYLKNIIKDSNDKSYDFSGYDVNYDVHYSDNMQELNRTEALITTTYTTNIKCEVEFILYGKLYIGKSDEFEECFETYTGLTLNELVNTNYIKSNIEKFIFDIWKGNIIDVKVINTFDDEVELLPSISDADLDRRADEIYENVNYRINGYPYEE